MSEFFDRHPWLKQVGREVIIALLLALLSVLGYNASVVQPRMQAFDDALFAEIQQARTDYNAVVSRAASVAKDSHISQLHVTGTTDLDGTLNVDGATTLVGAVAANAGITVDTSAFSVANTTGNTVISGTLSVTNTTSLATLNISGISTMSGALVANADVRFTAPTAISVTDGGIITATTAYQPLTSAGNVTVTIATSTATAGDLLLLTNGSNTTILIQDASTAMLSADMSLTQYDTLLLLFEGTNWRELARSTN